MARKLRLMIIAANMIQIFDLRERYLQLFAPNSVRCQIELQCLR